MKILYVVSRPLEINTSASVRNFATIKGFIELGYEVDLLTTLPDKNHSAYDESMIMDGLNIHYIKLNSISQNVAQILRKNKLLQPLRMFACKLLNKTSIYDNLVDIVNHVEEVEEDINEYDYIISSSDPKSSHLFVYKLLEIQPNYKGRWIQIWGDPFLGDITSTNSNDKRIRKEEEKLISKADKIIYVSELTQKRQVENYPKYSRKMVYVPIPYIKKEISEKKMGDIVELAYCGDYDSNVRNIIPLYKWASSQNRCHLTICGGSNLKLQSGRQVTVYPRISHEKVREIEKNADILVHLSNLKGSQIPGKIYQYSGTDKVILFLLDGDKEELFNMFDGYHRYYFADNTEKSISATIESIVSGSENGLIHNEALLDFEAKQICKRIIS